MSELEKTLKGGKKLIGFITAGDPDTKSSEQIALDVIDGGVDVLELGLPFSDPLADGPTIQAAGKRAIDGGMTTDRYFIFTKSISSKRKIPLVCLTYYNLILHYGLKKFAKSCACSGIHGVIVPDLPIEHAGDFHKYLHAEGVDFIFLVAETTPEDRLRRICDVASGFIYVVAILGTTGARVDVDPNVEAIIKNIKRMTNVPVAVGFGISRASHVKKVHNMGAEAAIVGSAIVSKAYESPKDLKDFVKRLS